ncbi:MAG: hypothetical protein WAU36_07605 [Cyclobacteriaceae bacterium]
MENRRSFIKKSGLFLTLSAFPFLKLFGLSRKPEEVVVTLYVDTARINKQDVNASCNFGQDPSIANEEFTIDVNLGDTVTWEGVSSNAPSNDVVNIVSINHEGGKNVFDKNILKGNGQIPESVTGTVKSKTGGGEKYKYKISFTVTNNGSKRNGMFHIDPKIQVH